MKTLLSVSKLHHVLPVPTMRHVQTAQTDQDAMLQKRHIMDFTKSFVLDFLPNVHSNDL